MSLYAANGSIRLTIVDGTTRTGLIAPDGSRYAVVSDGEAYVGSTHPCGAMWITHAPEGGVIPATAPDGSRYAATTRRDGALYITVVSGSLGDPAPDVPNVTNVDIIGDPEVGHEVEADPTTTGTGTITYAWNRGNGKISGEVSSTYTLTQADLNKLISATVSKGNKSGHKSKNSAQYLVTEDVTGPTITTASTANCAENATLSIALTASETSTWAITGGTDAADFEISGTTLRWASNGTKDYEAPDDSNSNNTYVVQVTATDVAENETDKTITVTVTDVSEAGHATTPAARYHRIRVTASQGGVCSIGEVEFWLDGTTKHSTAGKTVIVSGTGAGTAAEVFDGNTATWWYSGGSTGWIGIDFGSGNAVQVGMVAIAGRGAANQWPTTWLHEYSISDGTTWVASGIGGTTGAQLGRTDMKSYFTDPLGDFLHYRFRWTTDSSGAVRLAKIETRATVGGADISSTAIGNLTSSDVAGSAASMFDGNAATNWATSIFPAYVIVWFKDAAGLEQLLLQAPDTNQDQAPDHLHVDTSPDGIVWTDDVFFQTGFSAWTVGESRTYNL